jgi:hypothetical protein
MMLTEHQLKLYQLPIEVSSQYGIPASRDLIIEKYPTDSAAKKAYNKAMKQMNVIEIRADKKTKPKGKRKSCGCK